MQSWPVIITVRLLASIPSVTCSAVEADPNPLGPGLPDTNEKILIFHKSPKQQAQPQKTLLPLKTR